MRQSFRVRDAKRVRQRKAARAAGVKKAAGTLETVRAFLSTVARGERADELATPARLARWLEQHRLLDAGVTLGEAERKSALDLRRGLRALILAEGGAKAGAEALEGLAAAAGGRFALRFEDGVPVGFSPASRRFDDALGALVAIAVTARLEGSWERLRICPRSGCGLAFYDASQSATGRWCSTRCGEKHRAAVYRRRGPRR